MGLFSSLKDAILAKIGRHDERVDPSRSTPPPASADGDETLPPASAAPPIAAAPARLTYEELAAHLDTLAVVNPEQLEWRTSIVDLMKLVGMDSSYAERKEMALDLGYSQADIESKGSAEMNLWLHEKVLAKLSEDTDGDLTVA